MASTPTPVKLKKHHAGYRSWTTDWYDDNGCRRTKRIGKEGSLTARQAKAQFETWKQTEWCKAHVKNPDATAGGFTVADLARQYRDFAKTKYVKKGKVTTQIDQVNAAMDL